MADSPRQGHKYQFSRLELWRNHEAWTPRFSRVMPGFLPALGLFAGYVVLEKLYFKVFSLHGALCSARRRGRWRSVRSTPRPDPCPALSPLSPFSFLFFSFL